MGQVWPGLGRFSFGFRIGVGAGLSRRQVSTGVALISTPVWDRFGQVWAGLALVFVQVWDRFEQV